MEVPGHVTSAIYYMLPLMATLYLSRPLLKNISSGIYAPT